MYLQRNCQGSDGGWRKDGLVIRKETSSRFETLKNIEVVLYLLMSVVEDKCESNPRSYRLK